MKRTALASTLLFAVTWIVALPASGEENPPARQDPRPLVTLYSNSAISALMIANDGEVPKNGSELQKAMNRVGPFAQLPVAFSAVALDSGLRNPRVIFTPVVPASGGDTSGMWSLSIAEGSQRPIAIGGALANRPNLHGRLFLAANMTFDAENKEAVLRSVEFISWNSKRKQFDFGVIEGMETDTPELRIVDGVKCVSCHKTKGPILGAAPWSNTWHNSLVRGAAEPLLPKPTEPLNIVAERVKRFVPAKPVIRVNSLELTQGEAARVDSGVRLGAMLPMNRELFKQMARTPDGRRTLLLLLNAMVTHESISQLDEKLREKVNLSLSNSSTAFARKAADLRKATPSSVLHDFSPAGKRPSLKNPIAGSEWGGTMPTISTYDTQRASGLHGLPTQHLPSNPQAFMPAPVESRSSKPSQIVGLKLLAETIGLSIGDRKFLAETLDVAAKKAGKNITPASLAKAVFEGPQFTETLKGTMLPDRDEFKDRFVEGLNEVLKSKYGLLVGITTPRKEYSSAGERFFAEGDEPEPVIVATTGCIRCHDVRASGKPKFTEPLPALAFDPFDPASREAWLKTADKARKADVLGRMVKRMAVDKDMPPTDSPEHERFRVREPETFDAVRQLLEAEWKNVR